jgi:hypothetical protein
MNNCISSFVFLIKVARVASLHQGAAGRRCAAGVCGEAVRRRQGAYTPLLFGENVHVTGVTQRLGRKPCASLYNRNVYLPLPRPLFGSTVRVLVHTFVWYAPGGKKSRAQVELKLRCTTECKQPLPVGTLGEMDLGAKLREVRRCRLNR